MSGPLDDLVKRIMGSREGVLPSIQSFPPLDVEQIADELRLDSRAKEGCENELPPTESTVEDAVELDIAAELDRRARKSAEDYRSQLELYEGRIQRALLSSDLGVSVEAAGHNALTDFKIQASADLDHLHLARADVEGREREFEDFRKQNSLTRLPNIVPKNEKRVRWLVLAILMVFESVVNGAYFREGSESGWIGGIWQAFTLSLFNIGGAVAYVYIFLPLLFHASRFMKCLGYLAALAYVVWLLAINLIIAHFRDLYIENSGNVDAADVWLRISESPLSSLTDSQSWMLAILGIGFAIIALIDAAGLWDRYRGYAAVGRRREEAIARYVADKAYCLGELAKRRDEAISAMREVIDAMRSWEFELRIASGNRATLHRNFAAFLAHLIDGYKRLLRRYYDANSRCRKTPPPARFSRQPVEPAWAQSPLLAELPDLGTSARNETIRRMEYFIKEINRQFEEEAVKYESVREITTGQDNSRAVE